MSGSGHNGITKLKGSILYEQGCHHAFGLIHFGFNHRADHLAVGVRFDLSVICNQQNTFEQIINSLLLLAQRPG